MATRVHKNLCTNLFTNLFIDQKKKKFAYLLRQLSNVVKVTIVIQQHRCEPSNDGWGVGVYGRCNYTKFMVWYCMSQQGNKQTTNVFLKKQKTKTNF